MPDLDPEDEKILTLARSARARTGAREGAAVRDDTGRTYVAATVDRPALSMSALQLAVAMALSSGAQGFEAVALVGEAEALTAADRAVVEDVGVPTVLLAAPDGTVRA